MIPRSASSVGLRVRVQIADPAAWSGPEHFNGLVGVVEKFTHANEFGTVRELPFTVHFEPHDRPARPGAVEPLRLHWFTPEDLTEVGHVEVFTDRNRVAAGGQLGLFAC